MLGIGHAGHVHCLCFDNALRLAHLFPKSVSTLTLLALVNVLRAVDSLVSGGTGALVAAIDGTGVADGVNVTGLRGAGVLEMAQQPGFARCAATVEASDAVDTGGTVETRGARTVVDVGAAVGPGPTVDADARKAACKIMETL